MFYVIIYNLLLLLFILIIILFILFLAILGNLQAITRDFPSRFGVRDSDATLALFYIASREHVLKVFIRIKIIC